jgi:hypothetical protein
MTMCSNYEEGGLKMINIRNFLASLKIGVLRRLLQDPSKKTVIGNVCNKILFVKKCGAEYANVLMAEVRNEFWHDVMKHYKLFHNKCVPMDIQEFLSENIFYNGDILRDRKVIFIKNWIDAGITQIFHLLNDNGNWYVCNEFCRKYGIVCNFILYNGVLNAVKKYMSEKNMELPTQLKIMDPIAWVNINKGNRVMVDILNKPKLPPAAVTRWNTFFDSLDWKTIFSKRLRTSCDPRLIWFQTRLIYRILPTNRYLFLCKIVSNDCCTFCNLERETISHLFWSCGITQIFWKDLIHRMTEGNTSNNLKLSEEFILFGTSQNIQTDSVLDFIILCAKFFLYKCKLENSLPRLHCFLKVLQHAYTVEKRIFWLKGKSEQFDEAWLSYLDLVT